LYVSFFFTAAEHLNRDGLALFTFVKEVLNLLWFVYSVGLSVSTITQTCSITMMAAKKYAMLMATVLTYD